MGNCCVVIVTEIRGLVGHVATKGKEVSTLTQKLLNNFPISFMVKHRDLHTHPIVKPFPLLPPNKHREGQASHNNHRLHSRYV